jgi:hypothetical protein
LLETRGAGALTVNAVAEAAVTVARTPPNVTVLFAGVAEKPEPVIRTDVPSTPTAGPTALTVGTTA